MHWLAEQGLAPKRVFLVILPLIIFIATELVQFFHENKEDEMMKNNKFNTIDVLNLLQKVFNNLSGNIAGGALLTNALYIKACGKYRERK